MLVFTHEHWIVLTPTEQWVVLVLAAIWFAPNWGFKVVELIEAVRQLRREDSDEPKQWQWLWRNGRDSTADKA
jgi:hypothetical protein